MELRMSKKNERGQLREYLYSTCALPNIGDPQDCLLLYIKHATRVQHPATTRSILAGTFRLTAFCSADVTRLDNISNHSCGDRSMVRLVHLIFPPAVKPRHASLGVNEQIVKQLSDSATRSSTVSMANEVTSLRPRSVLPRRCDTMKQVEFQCKSYDQHSCPIRSSKLLRQRSNDYRKAWAGPTRNLPYIEDSSD